MTKMPKIHILRTCKHSGKITVLFEGNNWTYIQAFASSTKWFALQGFAYDLAEQKRKRPFGSLNPNISMEM
jgi:hypothetical protein